MNGVSLTAQYENESSILCIVGSGQVSVDNCVTVDSEDCMYCYPCTKLCLYVIALDVYTITILCTAHTFRWGQ